MKKKILIEGMSCGHCVKHVTEALKEIGATEVIVSLEGKFATAEVNEDVTDEVIKTAIEELEFEVVGTEVIS